MSFAIGLEISCRHGWLKTALRLAGVRPGEAGRRRHSGTARGEALRLEKKGKLPEELPHSIPDIWKICELSA
jgi:hypothetical protein